MTVLASLTSISTPLSTTPPDSAAPAAGRARGLDVRAVEYVQPVRDPLQERPRQAATRQGGARQAGTRQADIVRSEEERGFRLRDAGSRAAAPRAAISAPFLVQVLGQNRGRPQVFVSEHRDAAVRGSEAYRRAGATPPIYSELPTLFRIAV